MTQEKIRPTSAATKVLRISRNMLEQMGRLMDLLRGYLPWHLVYSALELGDRARASMFSGENGMISAEEIKVEELVKMKKVVREMQWSLTRVTEEIDKRIKELGG